MPTPVIVWDIFTNDGAGGPINYATPIATVSSPTFTTSALPLNSDNRFAVRARDSANALSELNVDAIVRIIVDGAGADVSALPPAPFGLTARAKSGGTAEVSFQIDPYDRVKPTQFSIYLTPFASGSPSWSTPAATISAISGRRYYRSTLTGLSDGASYWIGVRSSNGSIQEKNTTTIDIVGSSIGPASIDNLSISTGL